MSATGDRRGRRPRQSGTTLIEALVVVAITSLVALIAFPRLQQGLLGLGRREAVTAVAARLRQLRADALRGDRPAVFVIAADGRAYGPAGGATSKTPPGVELAARPAAIAFFGDGSSSGGTIWVVAANRSVPIVVAPATGAVDGGGQ